MNYIKRTIHSLTYHVKNTLLLFGIFTILFTLVLTGICILDACEQETEKIRKNIGASVEVSNPKISEYDVILQNPLTLSRAEKIAEFEEAEQFEYTVKTWAFIDGSTPVQTPEQAEEFGNIAPYYLYGDSDITFNRSFSNGNMFIVSGRAVEKTDFNSVIVSDSLASLNNWRLGDKIVLQSGNRNYTDIDEKYRNATLGLTIVGTFSVQNIDDQADLPYLNPENAMFTNAEAAWELVPSEEKKVSIAYYKMGDPKDVDMFSEKVMAMDIEAESEEDISCRINDSEYRNMAGALTNIVAIITVMVFSAVIMGIVVLILLILMSLKDRDFEIGILLSIGEAKVKIVTQLILESLITVVLAGTASVFLSTAISGQVGGALSDNINVVIGQGSILLMYLCGVALTLIASSVTVYKVVFYQPKKILMAME